MEPSLVTVAMAAGLFAATNVDDIVVLAVLNAASRAGGRPRAWQIWAGQYAGIAALVVISFLAALGLTLVPRGWIWLLGLLPLFLGLRKLWAALRARGSEEPVSAAVATGVPGVMSITIANGGDNIAAYAAVFRTSSGADNTVTIGVFSLGVALWCLAGSWLVSHRRVAQVIDRWGQWIVAVVFILIGLYVFRRGGVLGG